MDKISSLTQRVGTSLRRIVVALAIGAVLCSTAACGSSGASGSSAPTTTSKSHQSNPGTTAPPTLASCTLPLTHDTYDGFHIAVPQGWELTSLNGRVEVESDTAGTKAVVVTPALETGNLTPTSYFNSSFATLERQTRSGGGTVNATTRKGANGIPVASFTAHVSGVNLKGKATVSVLPLRTKLASTELVFIAYWAPALQFSSEENMLSSVGQCYGPEKATLFEVFRNKVFTYIAPPGWGIAGQNQNGLILNLGKTADVTYLLAEAVPASESGSAEGLIRYYLNSTGLEDVHALWTDTSPSETVSSGAEQQTAYEEFTGSIKGVADHGLVYSGADTGSDGFTSGVIRMALSTEGTWNALNSGLIQMAGSIQHKFIQDLEQLQSLNEEWQNFSGQVDNFDDVLNQQQLVEDPTTGTYYEAPYSAYDASGPDGPGYYTGNGQLLNPVQRP